MIIDSIMEGEKMELKKPKFELGEIVNVFIAGLHIPVRITNRKVIVDLDNEKQTVYYSFIHVTKITSPWDWADIPEYNLVSMIEKYNKDIIKIK